MLTNEQYVEGGGEQCPFCGRIGTIRANSPRSIDHRQRMACMECGSEWVDHYRTTLAGFTPLTPSTKNERLE